MCVCFLLGLFQANTKLVGTSGSCGDLSPNTAISSNVLVRFGSKVRLKVQTAGYSVSCMKRSNIHPAIQPSII